MSENFSRDIGYKIHKVVFVMDKIADSTLLSKADITLSQFMILMYIVEHYGLTQIQIANLLEITQAAVSRQIDVLENKNLIEIIQNQNNRRENLLFPSSLGKEVFEKANEILKNTFQKLYSIMSEKEKNELEQSLDKLIFTLCGKTKNFAFFEFGR